MASVHALVLPLPSQGHVIPLMELSHHLVHHGFKITFINTDFTHAQIAAAFAAEGTAAPSRINLVSLPDGLESGEATDEPRTFFGKVTEGMRMAMPPRLLELIRSSKDAGDEITCMIEDGQPFASMMPSMGLRTALCGTASVAGYFSQRP